MEIAEASQSPIAGKVLRSQFRGDGHMATVLVGSPESNSELQLISRTRLRSGDHVGLRIDPQHIRWFSRQAHK
jgi:iron(III) transport system ATP-binding protein